MASSIYHKLLCEGESKNSEHKIFSKKMKPNFSESKNVIRKLKRIEIAFCKEHFKFFVCLERKTDI